MSDAMLKLWIEAELRIAQLGRRAEGEEGQGMVEYGLILAVVAVIALTAFKTLGTNVNTLVNSLGSVIAGYPQSATAGQ